MKRPTARSLARQFLGWAFVIALLGLWEVFGRRDTSGLFPPFSDVLVEIWDLVRSDALTADILPSVVRALVGFVAGAAAAIVLGVALGWWRALEPWTTATLEFLRAVPVPALVPLAVVLYGSTDVMKVGIIALGAFWPVLLNTADGVRRVEPGYIESARVYTSGSHLAVLRRVVLPAATPQIMIGLRIGLAVSLILMVVSEMFGASSGLGYLILQAQRLYALTSMYAGVVILALIGLLLTGLFSAIEKRAMFWFDGMKGRTS
ncbi:MULTISPECIES: ABC transporter permease [unclassified Streptomyces]|uniref:ABC transporter permease n=1 Tax=unclassified Streptomyces TaxID=2593676 RepID=UPI0035D55FDE